VALLTALFLSAGGACGPQTPVRLSAVWDAAAAGDVAALQAALGDPAPVVRAEALRELARLEAPGAALTAFLADAPEAWRREAVSALADSGRRDAGAVSALRPLLEDPAPAVRADAALALGELGPLPDEALSALAARLGDGDPGVRTAAEEVLRVRGWPAAAALAAGLAEAEDGGHAARRRLLAALTGERLADPAWAGWLVGPVGGLRRLAAEGAWPDARAALAAGLRAPEAAVRREAVLALAHVAPPAEGVALAAAELSDPVELVRAAGLWGAAAHVAVAERLAAVSGDPPPGLLELAAAHGGPALVERLVPDPASPSDGRALAALRAMAVALRGGADGAAPPAGRDAGHLAAGGVGGPRPGRPGRPPAPRELRPGLRPRRGDRARALVAALRAELVVPAGLFGGGGQRWAPLPGEVCQFQQAASSALHLSW
jgi:HEAT repeat protein